MGGTNDENNLIDLYAREHFEAHRLLALENSHIKGLQFAWWQMTQMVNGKNLKRYVPTAEEYEEAKISFSKNMTGKNNPFYGHVYTEEEKEIKLKQLRDALEKLPRTEEWKRHISEGNKGKPKSEEHKNALREAKRRYYDNGGTSAWIGKHHKESSKEKMRMAKIGRKSPVCKKVILLETGEIFESVIDASRKLGIGEETVRRSCKNKDTRKGYSLRYYSEEENGA